MKESEMYEPMIEYLISNGFKIDSLSTGSQRGPDIIAKKKDKQLIIEMKGDTKALSVDLGTAIFQLMRTITYEKNKEYALAVTESYIRYIEQIKYPLEKLGIVSYIITDSVSIFS